MRSPNTPAVSPSAALPREPRCIMVLGNPGKWPAPLADAVARGVVRLEVVSDMHAAAAKLAEVRVPGGPARYAAVLLDPEYLSQREIGLLALFRRHLALPIWSLPSARVRKDMLRGLGILPWEDAREVLAQCEHKGITPQIGEGSNLLPQSVGFDEVAPGENAKALFSQATEAFAAPDNPLRDGSEKRPEIPVATELAARYDALEAVPVLSEPEIRALLGSLD